MNTEERQVIRELAKQFREQAELPVMEERRKLWFEHNDLKTTKPVIAVFPENAWHEIIKAEDLECEDELARKMEWLLRARLFRSRVIQDDVPAEKIWEVKKQITDTGWDAQNPGHKNQLFANETYCDSNLGNCPTVWKKGFVFSGNARHFSPVIHEYKDLKRIQTPEIVYHEKETLEEFKIQQDVLGDILNVQLTGESHINCGLLLVYTELRGLQEVYSDIYDEPEMLREAMEIICQGFHSLLDQYAGMGLLEINNRQGYNGSGGMSYTHDLPREPGGSKNLKNHWGFTESQEFCVVGPKQHYEFVQRYEATFAKRFGLISYGCFELLEDKLTPVLEFPNIRRISVSPWADIKKCASQIGKKAVYSWKVNPSYFINNFHQRTFFESMIKNMLEDTKDNCTEIILKDTGTCQNDPERFGEFVSLCRRLCGEVEHS